MAILYEEKRNWVGIKVSLVFGLVGFVAIFLWVSLPAVDALPAAGEIQPDPHADPLAHGEGVALVQAEPNLAQLPEPADAELEARIRNLEEQIDQLLEDKNANQAEIERLNGLFAESQAQVDELANQASQAYEIAEAAENAAQMAAYDLDRAIIILGIAAPVALVLAGANIVQFRRNRRMTEENRMLAFQGEQLGKKIGEIIKPNQVIRGPFIIDLPAKKKRRKFDDLPIAE